MNLVYDARHVAVIIPAVFGPERWSVKASRTLGVTERQIHRIVRGDRRFLARHLAIIENYLANRQRAVGTETKADLARAHRREARKRQGFKSAVQAISAHKAEKKRLASV